MASSLRDMKVLGGIKVCDLVSLTMVVFGDCWTLGWAHCPCFVLQSQILLGHQSYPISGLSLDLKVQEAVL